MKKLKVLYILLGFTINLISNAQTVIVMQKESGVYTTPCTVNGLKLRFIFDTGASNVSISLTEAAFMLKNGYLDKDDIHGSSYSQIANGEIIENTTVHLNEIEIGGIKIHNVEATVIHELNAPLLLGQSAIQKLGRIQIDGEKVTIFDKSLSNEITFKNENELIKEAEEGNAEAQYLLGMRFLESDSTVSERIPLAINWLEKAAKQNHAQAQFSLGRIYFAQDDNKKSVYWWTKAAEQGNYEAEILLAIVYSTGGVGVDLDYEKSAFWYEKHALKNDEEAELIAARLYDFSGNIKKAIDCYKIIVDKTYNLDIKFRLAQCYHIIGDYKKATELYLELADLGSPDAQYWLGVCYFDGIGLSRDYETAAYFFEKAAEMGHALSQYRIAMCFREGLGYPKYPEKAFYWMKKSAVQGVDMAQYGLGLWEFYGYSQSRDKEESAEWIKKSIEGGNKEAKEFWIEEKLWKYSKSDLRNVVLNEILDISFTSEETFKQLESEEPDVLEYESDNFAIRVELTPLILEMKRFNNGLSESALESAQYWNFKNMRLGQKNSNIENSFYVKGYDDDIPIFLSKILCFDWQRAYEIIVWCNNKDMVEGDKIVNSFRLVK